LRLFDKGFQYKCLEIQGISSAESYGFESVRWVWQGHAAAHYSERCSRWCSA
jgi:hypothetical protein